MEKQQIINGIISSNPSLFGLQFKDYIDGKVIFTDPSESAIKVAENNYQIFKDREKRLLKNRVLQVGDFVRILPNLTMRIGTHNYDKNYQLCHGGSFYLGNNGCSMSGSLDDLISSDDLVNTGELMNGSVWIFSENSSGGGRGVYSFIKFKIWEFKKEFDVEKLWPVIKIREKEYLETCEKVTRINGNGNEYEMPVPKLHILGDKLLQKIHIVENNTGLKFIGGMCQPQRIRQVDDTIDILKCSYNRYSNSCHENTLFLFDENETPNREKDYKNWKL